VQDNEAKNILEDKFATLSRSLLFFENVVVSYGPQAPTEEDNNFHEERNVELGLEVFQNLKGAQGRGTTSPRKTQHDFANSQWRKRCSTVS